MKEKIDRVKKFYRDHEEVILVLTGCTIGAAVASYASTKATLDGLSLTEVGYDEKNQMIQITYKNGNTDRYFPLSSASE